MGCHGHNPRLVENRHGGDRTGEQKAPVDGHCQMPTLLEDQDSEDGKFKSKFAVALCVYRISKAGKVHAQLGAIHCMSWADRSSALGLPGEPIARFLDVRHLPASYRYSKNTRRDFVFQNVNDG